MLGDAAAGDRVVNIGNRLVRGIACVTLLPGLLLSAGAAAEAVLSAATGRTVAGEPFEVRLTVTNPTAAPLAVELPSPLRARLAAAGHSAVIVLSSAELADGRSEAVVIAPGAFRALVYGATMPATVSGPTRLLLVGLDANPLDLQVEAAGLAGPGPTPPDGDCEADAGAAATTQPGPFALSQYEPVYLAVGTRGSRNAKFQISFKYRLFDATGRLAGRMPWLGQLYLGYSQTSLADLDEPSKPFHDSSYRPRLFYVDDAVRASRDGGWRLGVEAGLGHDSNGKDGDGSRSVNFAYARPTLTVGDPDGPRLYVAPVLYAYLDAGENPRIREYRGYADLTFGYASRRGWNAWATLRQGTRRFGSAEVNAAYPLARLSDGHLSGWLLLQHFDGYGESLLDYDRRLPAQWRVGLALSVW